MTPSRRRSPRSAWSGPSKSFVNCKGSRCSKTSFLRRLANPESLTAADVKIAEDLLAAHPEEKPLRDLLETVLVSLAQRLERTLSTAEANSWPSSRESQNTVTLSRIAGNGEVSDEILASGREAVLGQAAAKPVAKKTRVKTH